jgi:hypothetical protein
MTQTTYEGSCHCGAVRWAVTMPQPEKAYAGNCSMCMRAGWLLAFAPATAFTLVAGEDSLRDYQFGKRTIRHYFCATCGVRSFGRGKASSGEETASINLRCITGLDPTALPVESFDCAGL